MIHGPLCLRHTHMQQCNSILIYCYKSCGSVVPCDRWSLEQAHTSVECNAIHLQCAHCHCGADTNQRTNHGRPIENHRIILSVGNAFGCDRKSWSKNRREKKIETGFVHVAHIQQLNWWTWFSADLAVSHCSFAIGWGNSTPRRRTIPMPILFLLISANR